MVLLLLDLPYDFTSLHSVYERLMKSAKYNIHCTISLERGDIRFLTSLAPISLTHPLSRHFFHSIVTRTVLVWLGVRAQLCDGASTNLYLLKLLCGY